MGIWGGFTDVSDYGQLDFAIGFESDMTLGYAAVRKTTVSAPISAAYAYYINNVGKPANAGYLINGTVGYNVHTGILVNTDAIYPGYEAVYINGSATSGNKYSGIVMGAGNFIYGMDLYGGTFASGNIRFSDNTVQSTAMTSTIANDATTAYGWGNHATAGYLTSGAIGSTVQAYNSNLTGINQALDTSANATFLTLTIAGGGAGNKIILDNLEAYAVKDAGGTARGMMRLDSSNIAHIADNAGCASTYIGTLNTDTNPIYIKVGGVVKNVQVDGLGYLKAN
jgi:hypothetical protein